MTATIKYIYNLNHDKRMIVKDTKNDHTKVLDGHPEKIYLKRF